MRPPLVLWVINQNTVDSWHELKDPLLARYLERGLHAGVDRPAGRSGPRLAGHRSGCAVRVDRRSLVVIKEAEEERFEDILTPAATARASAARRAAPAADPRRLICRCSSAWCASPETTLEWGGDFVVVIMPLYEDVVVRQMSPSQRHEHLAQVLREEGIDVIDTCRGICQPATTLPACTRCASTTTRTSKGIS